MATYLEGGGASIKETGSLKRTTAGTSSKSVGANEYALVSFYHTKDSSDSYTGASGGLTQYSGSTGAVNGNHDVALTGLAAGQYLVGGGVSFSVVWTAVSVEFQIDGVEVYKSGPFYGGTPPAMAHYVIFE